METRIGPSSISELQEQLEQHQVLIEQLKGMVRANEDSSRHKERELKESAAKLSKMKLQHKARVAQLTSQLNELQKSKGPLSTVEGDEEASAESSSPDHGSRGKVIMLKKKLEENRILFEKQEKEMCENKRSIESRLEEMQTKLNERDKKIQEMETSVKISERRGSSCADSSSDTQLQDMYAQMVYKDSKIIELNNHILQLETNIMDLQENLKEKDEVIQSRNKAIQLMTDDLSKKGKSVVDQLDDTRDQMKVMQEHFITVEAAWKEEQTRLNTDLEALKDKHENYVTESNARLAELKTSIAKLESVRFDLSTKNAQLQEKIVHLQESLEKEKQKEKQKPSEDLAEDVKCLTEEKEKLQAEIAAKALQFQELQTISNQAIKSADQKLIKLKAQHQNRIKALESQIQDLKESNDLSENVTILKNQLVELEEEKGNLQLKLVEYDDIQQSNEKLKSTVEELQDKLRHQSDDLDNYLGKIKLLEYEKLSLTGQLDEKQNAMEKYKTAMEDNSIQMRNLQDSKVSLEMRLVEIEELRDSFEGQRQDLMAEVAVLQRKLVGDDKSVFAIEQEKSALQIKLTETENALKDAVEKCCSFEAELEELRHVRTNLTDQFESLSADKERLSVDLANTQQGADLLQEQCKCATEQLKKTLDDQENIINSLARKFASDEAPIDSLILTWDGIIEKVDEYKKAVEEKENTLRIELQQLKLLHENEEETRKAEKEQLNCLIEKHLEEVRTLKENIDAKNAENLVNCESLEVQIKENKFLEELLQHKEECFKEKSQQVHDLQQEFQVVRESHLMEMAKAESKVASLFNQLNDVETEISRLQQEISEKQVDIETALEERDCAVSEAVVLRDTLAKEEINLQDALDKINDLESTYLTENKMLKEEYNQMQQQLQSAKDEVNRHQNNVACKEKELEQLGHKMQTYIGYEDEIRLLHAQLEDALNRNTEFGNQFRVLQLEYEISINELNAVKLQIGEMEGNLSKVQSELTLSRQSYGEKESAFVALEAKYRDLEKELSEAVSAKQVLQTSASNSNEEYESIVSSHDEVVKDMAEKYNRLEKDKAILEEKLRENEKISAENQFLVDKIQNLEEGNNNLSERLAAAQNAEDSYSKEIDSLQNKVKELQENLDESQHSVECMKDELSKHLNKEDELEINWNTSKEALCNCEFELEKARGTLVDMTNELDEKRAQLIDCEIKIRTFMSDKEELGAYVNTVESEKAALLTEMREISNKAQEQYSEHSAMKVNLEIQLKQMNERDNILMELVNEKDVLMTHLDQARDRIDLLLAQVSQLEDDKSNAQLSNDKLVMYVEQLESDLKTTAESLQNAQEEFQALQDSNTHKSNRLEALSLEIGDLENDISGLQQQNEELKEKLTSAEQQLHNFNVQLENVQRENENLRREQEDSDEMRMKIESLQEDLRRAEEVSQDRQLLHERVAELMYEKQNLVADAVKTNEDSQEFALKTRDLEEKLVATELSLQSCQMELELRNKEITDTTDRFEVATNEITNLQDLLEVEKKNLHDAHNTISLLNAEKVESHAAFRDLLENVKVLKAQNEEFLRDSQTTKAGVATPSIEEDVKKESEVVQQSSPVEDEEKIQLRRQLQNLRLKSGKMLAKLKAFKEKNDAMEQSGKNFEEKLNTLVLNEESLKASNQELQLHLETLKQEIARLEESVRQLRDKEDALEVANETLVDIKETLERKIEEKIAEKDNVESRLADLAKKCEELTSALEISNGEVLKLQNELYDAMKKEETLTFANDGLLQTKGMLEQHIDQLNVGFKTEKELLESKLKEMAECEETLTKKCQDLSMQVKLWKETSENLTAKEDAFAIANSDLVRMKEDLERQLAEKAAENESFEHRIREWEECEFNNATKCADLCLQLESSRTEITSLLEKVLTLENECSSVKYTNETLKEEIGEKIADLGGKEDLEMKVKELEESELSLKKKLEALNEDNLNLRLNAVLVKDDAAEAETNKNLLGIKENLERQLDEKTAEFNAEKEDFECRMKELVERERYNAEEYNKLSTELEISKQELVNLLEEVSNLKAANDDLIGMQESLQQQLKKKMEDLQKEDESSEAKIKAMEENEETLRRKCQELLTELDISNEKIVKLRSNVVEKESSVQVEMVSLMQVNESMKLQVQESCQTIQNLHARLSFLEAENNKVVEELQFSMAREREKSEHEIVEIHEQNRLLESDNIEFQTLNDQLRDFKVKLEQELASCKLLLDEGHRFLAIANDEKIKLELEIQELKDRITSTRSENDTLLENLNREKESKEKLDEQDIAVYRNEVDKLSTHLAGQSQLIASLERDIWQNQEKLELCERSKEIAERREGELAEEVHRLKCILVEREIEINDLKTNVNVCEQLRVKLQDVETNLTEFVQNLGIEGIEDLALQEPLEALLHLETYIRKLQLENSNLEDRVRQLQENKRNLEVQVNQTHLVQSYSEQTEKMPILQAELQRTMESLHARDIRCENLTMDISNLIDERDSLQLRLATTLTRERHLELELRKLQHNLHSDSISARENDVSALHIQLSGESDLSALQKKLDKNESLRFELQQMNAALEEALASEREDRLNIQTRLKFAEEELAALGRRSQKDSVHINFDEEEHPLLVPENEKTLVRSYTSTTWRIANWIQGRSTPRVLHV